MSDLIFILFTLFLLLMFIMLGVTMIGYSIYRSILNLTYLVNNLESRLEFIEKDKKNVINH